MKRAISVCFLVVLFSMSIAACNHFNTPSAPAVQGTVKANNLLQSPTPTFTPGPQTTCFTSGQSSYPHVVLCNTLNPPGCSPPDPNVVSIVQQPCVAVCPCGNCGGCIPTDNGVAPGNYPFTASFIVPSDPNQVTVNFSFQHPADNNGIPITNPVLTLNGVPITGGNQFIYDFTLNQVVAGNVTSMGTIQLSRGTNSFIDSENNFRGPTVQGGQYQCLEVSWSICENWTGQPLPQTPTPTSTPTGTLTPGTPTNTPTISPTPTITFTPTVTPTPTPSFNLKLEANPNTIAPLRTNGSSNTVLKALVTDSQGNPAANVNVAFQFLEGTGGGHDDGHTGTRPGGNLNPSSCTTGSDGTCQVTYTAGEVGGQDTIQAILVSQAVTATINLNVQVSGLVDIATLLGAYPHLHLSTRTSALHPNGHFGQPNAMTDLFTGLEAVAEQYGQDISINDVSLEDGGLFDIHGDWRPPHGSHRFGTDADIEFLALYREHRRDINNTMRDHHERFMDEHQFDPNNPTNLFPHFRYRRHR